MAEDQNTSMTFLGHVRGVMLAGASLIASKSRTYGPSWKQRGGQGAWFTTVRPWDRLETIVARHGGDIFAAVSAEPQGGDGTALDAIRDVRNYLALIEAEMVARGTVAEPQGEELNVELLTDTARDWETETDRILRLLSEGEDARATGKSSPYGGQTLEHALHAYGWVKHDLRMALILASPTYARSQGIESPPEATQSVSDLGVGELHDGRYTTLDLGASDELWQESLGAIPSPWPGPRNPLFSALCSLGDASIRLATVGALVASRRLRGGDLQVIVRIPSAAA